MAKYKYSANVDLKRGNVINGTKLNFTVDEKVFQGKSDIKELNRIALRYVKSQNREKVSEYEKVEVRGFNKLNTVSKTNNTRTSSSRKSYSRTKKKGGIIRIFIRLISKSFNLLEKLLR